MITLQELLESRDRRAARQGELLAQYPGRVLLCLTVQLPGPEKRNELSLKIARAGVDAVKALKPEYEEVKDLETGFEGYFVFDMEPLALKKLAASIEDTHPLGRLMDLDVMCHSERSERILPLSRADIGLPERKCLLCENPARYCMRARTHTTEELLKRIEQICNDL